MNQLTEIKGIQFVTTYKCNVACAHCAYSASPKRTERLYSKDVKSIFDSLKGMAVDFVNFGGGESILFLEDLLESVSIARTFTDRIGL